MTNDKDQLIGIPLQTKMIAEIYCDIINSEKDLNSIELNNISDFYHEFVERKFDIQYEEKNKIEKGRDEDDYEQKKVKFYEDHIKYSKMILFKENILSGSISQTEEKRIIKFGIIVNFKDKIPIFLHQSYAEYFLAKHVIEIIKENQDEKDEVINQILSNKEFFLVRKFLNNFLLKQDLQVIRKTENTNPTLQIEIGNCCRENLTNKII